MASIESMAEAREVARILQDRDDLDPQTRENMLSALRDFDTRQSQGEVAPTIDTPEPEQPQQRAKTRKGRREEAPTREPMEVAKQAATSIYQIGRTVGQGAVAEPAAGIMGILELVGGGGIDQAVERINETRDMLGYTPDDPATAAALYEVAKPLMALEEGVDRVAASASFGNPEAATIIKTAILGLPEIMTLGKLNMPKRVASSLKHNTPVLGKDAAAKRRLETVADEMGIDLESPNLRESTVTAAKGEASTRRGTSMDDLQTEVVARKQARDAEVQQLYDTAAQHKAYVNVDNIKGFVTGQAQKLLQKYDLEEMPAVQRTLASLNDLDFDLPGIPGGRMKVKATATSLNNLEIHRRRINARIDDAKGSEKTALISIKKDLDTFVDNQFNKALIKGDADALEAWKLARAERTRYKRDFSDIKAIKELTHDLEATPEMMRRWIFGASANGMKPEAVKTVRRLKDILGENHPSIEALRQDFLMDVAEPLFGETPNFKGFITKYDNLIGRNPEIVKELGLNTEHLRVLRAASVAADRLPKSIQYITKENINQAAAQFFVGHAIARAALRVRLVRMVANGVLRAGQKPRRQILSEIVAADHGRPMIPSSTPEMGTVISDYFFYNTMNMSEEELEEVQRNAMGVTHLPPIKSQK